MPPTEVDASRRPGSERPCRRRGAARASTRCPAGRAERRRRRRCARSSCWRATCASEGRYSDGASPASSSTRPGHDLDGVVDGFLLARRPVGDDEQYAAAMAMLANRVGVPARVVVGACCRGDGKVRGEDVHAWVEVRVADGSWRTLPTKEFMSRTRAAHAGCMPVARRPEVPPSRPQEQAPEPAAATASAASSRTAPTGRVAAGRCAPLPWLLAAAARAWSSAWLEAAPVVPYAAGEDGPSDRMAGAWVELVDHARDLRHPGQGARLETGPGAGGVARAGGLSRERRRRRLRRGRTRRAPWSRPTGSR